MDTKSKKSRPFAAWLCFFLAVNLIGLLLFTGLAAVLHDNGNMGVLSVVLGQDYKDTQAFKEQTAEYFSQLMSLVGNLPAGEPYNEEIDQISVLETTQRQLEKEGVNLRYYASNQGSGLLFKNFDVDLSAFPRSMPAGYKYIWYFDGQKVSVLNDGKSVDIKRLDSGYLNIIYNEFAYNTVLPQSKVILAVKDTLVKNPYGYSEYYQQQQFMSIIGWVYLVLGISGIIFLVFAIICRRQKREFEERLAAWSGQLWFEVKAFISLLLLILLTNLSLSISGWSDPLGQVLSAGFASCCILAVLWWFYLMLLDLIANKKAFFTHNIINSLIAWYGQYERRYVWQKVMLKRAFVLVAVELVLALLAVFLLVSSDTKMLLIALFIVAAGIYLLYRYLQYYAQTLTEMGELTDHIELIKNGDMQSRLEFAPDADLYPAARDLNAIQEGMNKAVAEMMKSERLKIDLITNVSHDLKTPLTSIISYVDLLSREENLPEHVKDYIKILSQKSERLKNLIQDLFDLSQASSENVRLELETIDLARLMKQTLADMDEQINASGLSFRLNIPDEPIYILSDGKKLYRVWENLIANSLKYSLDGSRVFIDLMAEEKEVMAVIKNIANYEMTFDEDDILQRFVRGDESRSTEGSGLGLSIAQSFTQICGGSFAIITDGDLFKAELRFNII